MTHIENRNGTIVFNGVVKASPYTAVIDGVSYTFTTNGTNIGVTK